VIEDVPEREGSLALVPARPSPDIQQVEDDVLSSESNNKMRATPNKSADQAEAASQPRPMQ
jgi:hypothetical protein